MPHGDNFIAGAGKDFKRVISLFLDRVGCVDCPMLPSSKFFFLVSSHFFFVDEQHNRPTSYVSS